MRLDNVPGAIGGTVLGVGSFFLGFPAALPWGIGAYAVALLALLVYVVPRPMYDHQTPVPVALGIFGLTYLLASIYLFLRLWLWAPHELWFLAGVPLLGAAVTLAI